MKTIHLFSKIMIVMGLLILTSNISAEPQLFIKNATDWDLKMKFAAPDRNATESVLAAYTKSPNQTNNIYRIGSINNMYEINNLSIRRSGWGSTYVSGWTSLDVNSLRRYSEQFITRQTIPSFETDIYWTIYGWDA